MSDELTIDFSPMVKAFADAAEAMRNISSVDLSNILEELKAKDLKDRESRRWAEDPLCILIDEDGYPRFHDLDELRWNLACALESLAEWVRPKVY